MADYKEVNELVEGCIERGLLVQAEDGKYSAVSDADLLREYIDKHGKDKYVDFIFFVMKKAVEKLKEESK